MPPLPGQVPFHLSKQLSLGVAGLLAFCASLDCLRPAARPPSPGDARRSPRTWPHSALATPRALQKASCQMLSQSCVSFSKFTAFIPPGKVDSILIRTGGAQKGNTTTRARAHTHTCTLAHRVPSWSPALTAALRQPKAAPSTPLRPQHTITEDSWRWGHVRVTWVKGSLFSPDFWGALQP